jgi:hypothetical protein
MLMELGRGPLIFRLLHIETNFQEKHFDLGIGSRGFRVQVRDAINNSEAVLRISNIKGEVSKNSNADPKPLYWTVYPGTHFEGFLGLRVMVEDAPKPDSAGNAVDVLDGVQGEQRWYVTSAADNTEIEIIEVPGS